MNEQAKKLQELTENNHSKGRLSKMRTLVVTGGKGGVGKTSIAANLSILLANMGKAVTLLDADLALANVDILLGLTPNYNLQHLILGSKTIEDIIIKGPGGINVIPASSGVNELATLNSRDKDRFITAIEPLENKTHIMVIDTAAGISSNVTGFMWAADELIVVTTPDPSAYSDAYATIKVASKKRRQININLLVNMAACEEDAIDTYKRIKRVAQTRLSLDVGYLGFIPRDPMVTKAGRMRKPFIEAFPQTMAAKALADVAKKILLLPSFTGKAATESFFERLWRFLI